jgi:NitT/TauT family transport system substrate-binding protein
MLRGITLAACLLVGCKEPKPGAFRVGYMPNVTHAPALWALESGALQKSLGPEVTLSPKAFNAGPAIIEALFAGELDAAYIGPNPAINGFQKSKGTALRIVAGASTGGAQLVVQADIEGPARLAGKRIASPQLGNTQDVALRTWLSDQKISAEVVSVANPDAVSLFARKEIAGAWLPEPWSSRLVLESNGKVLVDDANSPTVLLIASTAAIDKRSAQVEKVVEANEQAVAALGDPAARALVGARLAKESGKPLPANVLDRAFSKLSFSSTPDEAQLQAAARQAKALGFLASDDLAGLVEKKFLPAAKPTEPVR